MIRNRNPKMVFEGFNNYFLSSRRPRTIAESIAWRNWQLTSMPLSALTGTSRNKHVASLGQRRQPGPLARARNSSESRSPKKPDKPVRVTTPEDATGVIRVLIVDDHTSLCAGLQRFLGSMGYSVSTADCVKAALSSARDHEFDLHLLDLNLPDGTGWDLLKRLTTKSPVRAIAMSGWGSTLDIAQSEGAGFMRHLVKPVTPEELIEAIEDVMQRIPTRD